MDANLRRPEYRRETETARWASGETAAGGRERLTAQVYAKPNSSVGGRTREEIGIAGVARNSDRVLERDRTKDQRHLSLRQCVRASHEIDVAHGAPAADREIKDRRSDTAA